MWLLLYYNVHDTIEELTEETSVVPCTQYYEGGLPVVKLIHKLNFHLTHFEVHKGGGHTKQLVVIAIDIEAKLQEGGLAQTVV